MTPIKLEIPKELFSPAEFHSYSEHADIGEVVVGSTVFSFPEGVDWKCDITNTGGALLARGTVSGIAITDCSRCLEEAKIEVIGDIEGYFIINSESSAISELEADEFELLGEDKTIDLAPLINAALVLALPQIPLCQVECRGLCPHCGNNLNLDFCDCNKDKPLSATNPFSALKDFNFN